MKYIERLGSSFMSHYARRLADLINEQSTDVLKEFNLRVPASAISTLQYLNTNKNITVAHVASDLGVTHQMATQRINTLEKLSLVERHALSNDKRAKKITLSIKGLEEIKTLQPLMKRMSLIFEQFETELGHQLSQTIYQAETSLRQRSLKERFNDTEN